MQEQPEIILLGIPTASGAVIPVILIWNRAAVQTTAKPDVTDAQELKTYVESKNGLVDQQTANRYVNQGLYGGFGPSFSFEKLPLETRLNLYESYVKNAEVTPNHQAMLDGLHQTLGLEPYLAEFGKRQNQALSAFLDNKQQIEQLWSSEGRNSTFEQTLNHFVKNFDSFSAESKIEFLQFLENVAAKAHGRDPIQVTGYVSDKEGDIGVNTGKGIGLNVESRVFKKDPYFLINAVLHEGSGHAVQNHLSRKIWDGAISKDDPNYVVARIFHAQMSSRGGYIDANNLLGSHQAYEDNFVEKDARRAGETGALILLDKYNLLPRSAYQANNAHEAFEVTAQDLLRQQTSSAPRRALLAANSNNHLSPKVA